jgi:hypothetical protein
MEWWNHAQVRRVAMVLSDLRECENLSGVGS